MALQKACVTKQIYSVEAGMFQLYLTRHEFKFFAADHKF